MLARENHAQYVWRSKLTLAGGRLIAAVAHCTAVATSWPLVSAWNAPCAAAWHALAGAPPRLAQANHSAYDLSSGEMPCALSALVFCWTTSHVDFAAAGCACGWGVGATGSGAGAVGAG